MGMPMELNTMIVTKGREVREEENQFRLEKDGYRLYPIDIPVDIRKTIESETSGTAVIQRVAWEAGKTIITYHLVSLKSIN